MGRADPWHYHLFLVLISLCAIVGMFIAFRLQRENAEESTLITDEDRLEEFERAYYEGEMTREEFERVKAAFNLTSSATLSPRPTVEKPAPHRSTDDSTWPISEG